MRRSKLEVYVEILKVLVYTGPLKLTQIVDKSNLKGSLLKEYLYFLIKQDLVEERTVKKRHIVFAVTQRGITVLKYFQDPLQEISGIEKT
jgi:predicted transcriptional regulator